MQEADARFEELAAKAAEPPGLHERMRTHSYVPLLCLLELPYPTVAARFTERFQLPDSELCRLAEFALASDSDYWAELALSWLEQGLLLDPGLATVLQSEPFPRHMQRERHRAAALLRAATRP